MLGDTSMGMINGYFGPRLLNPIGFTEHKVDQAWIIDRGRRIDDAPHRRRRSPSSRTKGVTFHWGEDGRGGLQRAPRASSCATTWPCSTWCDEFKADCLGWQYQLGLIPLRPPSDFAEGLLNSVCRPESNGDTIVCSTEADQGNLVPMELMKRLLKAKGLHQAVMFHDVRWGAEHDGRFLWVLLNSGSCGAYAFNHDPDTLAGVHSYRQPAGVLPDPRRHLRRREPARARSPGRAAYLKDDELWMDIGRGEVVELPAADARRWWQGTDAPVAVHGGRPRHPPGHAHGALPQQPHRGRLRRHLRGDGRALSRSWASGCASSRTAALMSQRQGVVYLGVDVGTGSARAGVFDQDGRRLRDRRRQRHPTLAARRRTSSSSPRRTSGARCDGRRRNGAGRGRH